MKIKVDQCMHLKRQKIGFSIEREKLRCYIFLHFINPASIVYKGRLIRLSANCVYIGEKDTPIFYKAEHVSLLHNFVHFDVDDPSELEKIGLVFNTPFYTDLQEDITSTIERMEWMKNSPDAIMLPPVENSFENLLRRLAVERKAQRISTVYTDRHDLDNLRTQVYLHPGQWNVTKMAEYVHLSRSHFSLKYKEVFGVTPNFDINTAAMLEASKLLITTDLSVNKIGKRLGYSRSDYFIRIFKEKYGVTPIEYRKINAGFGEVE